MATCDRDLKRRVRKIPGIPIMYVANHKYAIERLPDDMSCTFACAMHACCSMRHSDDAMHACGGTMHVLCHSHWRVTMARCRR